MLFDLNLFVDCLGLIAAAEEIGGGNAGGQSYVISPACAKFLTDDGVTLSHRGMVLIVMLFCRNYFCVLLLL